MSGTDRAPEASPGSADVDVPGAHGTLPAFAEVVLATRNEGKRAELEALLDQTLGARVPDAELAAAEAADARTRDTAASGTEASHAVDSRAGGLGTAEPGAGVPGTVRVRSAADLDLPDVVEDGVTFAENALLKARSAAACTGLPAMADDSGLSVDVMGGAPGIFSARWSGVHGDDAANNALLLAQLADVRGEHRGAAFICAAAFVHPDGTEIVRHGRFTGTLLRAPRGAHGFGYDPLFLPAGGKRSAAELTPQEKNRVSHRALAFRALAAALCAAQDGRTAQDAGTP